MIHSMNITERQKNILQCIVKEYINGAFPISSQFLENKYDFGVSGATLRHEMLELSEKGFLDKPYSSSGRVPTDKGYRFLVDEMPKRANNGYGLEVDLNNEISEGLKDSAEWSFHIAKNLASLSSSLAAVYFKEQEVIFKEGWEDLLKEPEFEDQNSIKSFTRLLEDFEKNIDDIVFRGGVQVFIGREVPFSRVRDFTVMVVECEFPQNKKGILAFLGPKRMEYPKNIHILNTWTKLLTN